MEEETKCFRATPETQAAMEIIRVRHDKTFSKMMRAIMLRVEAIEKSGKLDSWLLETSSEGDQS